MGFRNAWTYSFLLLLTIFLITVLLMETFVGNIEGYTNRTGSIMNMTLYLLPLITLLLGGFSASVEKENGQWGLLATYPITSHQFLIGKWLGLVVILLTILFFSFGITGIITVLFGKEISLQTLLFFWGFSILLAIVYLSIATLIGAIAKNRWQALIGAITVWFVTVVIWPLLMISSMSMLPSYQLVQPTLQILTLANPAELIRVFAIVRMGAGSMFGATYHEWITWVQGSSGLMTFIGIISAWIIISLGIGGWLWKRGEQNGTS